MTAPSFPIDSIIIGERHRRDLGDIEGFAARIARLGVLLQPIGVRPDGRLIWGERRLRACQLLGWTEIPARIIDTVSIAEGEAAENLDRKDFTPSELVAIGRDVERIEREQAQKRQGSRTDLVESCHEVEFGKTRDKIAERLGISGRTYEKAKAVVDAAEAEPEKFGKLKEGMDRTGRVNGFYKQLHVARQAALIRAEPPPLPGNGPYRVIVVDFPWADEIRREDPSHRANTPYPQMTLKEICAFPLASILTPDAEVWMWFTSYHVHRGIHRPVLDAHGLESKAMLTWGKPHFGRGDTLRGQTEHCILAVRGKPIVEISNQSTWLLAPPRKTGGHSAKPVEFYDLVESLCPAPRYADLFSRYRHNDKWDCHGDEAPPHPLDIPPSLRRSAS
jgi:N6-adenosine-specific RNA methylase IME4